MKYLLIKTDNNNFNAEEPWVVRYLDTNYYSYNNTLSWNSNIEVFNHVKNDIYIKNNGPIKFPLDVYIKYDNLSHYVGATYEVILNITKKGIKESIKLELYIDMFAVPVGENFMMDFNKGLYVYHYPGGNITIDSIKHQLINSNDSNDPIEVNPSGPIEVNPSEPIEVNPSGPIEVNPSGPIEVNP